MRETEIARLDDFSKAVYSSFVLKRGFWWGKLNGKKIAFCEKVDSEGRIKVYVQAESGDWKPFLVKREVLKERYPNLQL